MAVKPPDPEVSELRATLKELWPGLAGIAFASCLINAFMLTGPIFMLQVYDRVLPSKSGATLVGLGCLALFALLFQGLVDTIRARILLRMGRVFDAQIRPKAYRVLSMAPGAPGLQATHDVDSIRSFLSGNGVAAFFDLPWVPLYLAICFAFHPAIGTAILLGAGILCGLTILGDRLSRQPMLDAVPLFAAQNKLTEAIRRNAVLISALGMRSTFGQQWLDRSNDHLDRQQNIGDIAVCLASISRTLRTILQSGVLALGAWLVINQEATGGVMLAATILTIRALAPVEAVIANWRGFIAASQAWSRLDRCLAEYRHPPHRTPIPRPAKDLALTNVALAAPGTGVLVAAELSFRLTRGDALGVIGTSGSGKSSLARTLVGAWPAARGVVRLDGATLDQWDEEMLGAAIGYMPQDVELFSGTVAENICRFQPRPDPAELARAARLADVHELIVKLKDGYETQVGEGGAALSGGQRQRIGLARALYGNPFLVVLDEPNSNLDAQGELALGRAIAAMRQLGSIVIVMAHRPSALAAVSHLLVLNDGRMADFGPRDQVLARLAGPQIIKARPAAAPIKRPTRNKVGGHAGRPRPNGHAAL